MTLAQKVTKVTRAGKVIPACRASGGLQGDPGSQGIQGLQGDPGPTGAESFLPNQNTAKGEEALFSLATGIGNTGIGYQALYTNADGNYNTAIGVEALLNNTTGFNNTAIGIGALANNSEGSNNTATGGFALSINRTGNDNTATGVHALEDNSEGSSNTANGESALWSNAIGNINTAIGVEALGHNTTGSENIGLGFSAGSNLTTGDSNIDIGNRGIAGESSTIRIGNPNQTRTFVTGIFNATTSGGTAVFINSCGQLGTVSSSRRFKKEIKPMEQASEAILSLKPVTFHYKSDAANTPQFGLIAEEVAEVNPDLVVRDGNGEIYTVRYEAVNAMLLNEFLKQHRKVEEQEATIAQLKNGIERLAAHLKQQDSKIEKVSAQLEARSPAAQVVINNQ